MGIRDRGKTPGKTEMCRLPDTFDHERRFFITDSEFGYEFNNMYIENEKF